MLRLLRSDTIYALSSAVGKAGVSVIRVSGKNVKDVTMNILNKNMTDRVPRVRKIVCPDTKDVIDPSALVLYFQENMSFTGESTLELQNCWT